MRLGYHVTTPRRLEYHQAHGVIEPPVHFWSGEDVARGVALRTGRVIIIVFPWPEVVIPGSRQSYWTPSVIRDWRASRPGMMLVVCAWCLQRDTLTVLREIPGLGVSHGMCPLCLDTFSAEHARRKGTAVPELQDPSTTGSNPREQVETPDK